jgi:Kef-type K+ transport system membrane component KefB
MVSLDFTRRVYIRGRRSEVGARRAEGAGAFRVEELTHRILIRMSSNLTVDTLLALAVVVITGRLLGKALATIGQPPVIGEVLAGILLGPSLVGRLSPSLEMHLFPDAVKPALGVVAQIGVVLYMFSVGVEFDAAALRRTAARFVFVSQASIAVPFVLGLGIAAVIRPEFALPGVTPVAFSLFMGIAMSITAFPVLARILTDRNLTRTELGIAALTCAAVDDVTAWCLLAIVVGVTRAALSSGMNAAGLAAVFIAFMFVVARPIAARIVRAEEGSGGSYEALAWTLAGLLISAVVAEAIGIHAIFGAFLYGAILPHDSALGRRLGIDRIPIITILFLPAFFALTGLRTEIGLVTTANDWAICALITAAAIAGKFGGTLIGGKLVGLRWRFAARLGILMNTRGLMELIVLNVGLDLGVLSARLFTMMVIMAVVTTAMTAPLLDAMRRGASEA